MTVSSSTLRTAVLLGSGLLGLPAALLAADRLLASDQINHVPPSFTEVPAYPGVNAKWRFTCFHGLSGPTRFEPLRPFMNARGPVMLASSGSNFAATSRAALAYSSSLNRTGELPEVVIGLSLGTHSAIEYLLGRQMGGHPVERAVLIGGPPRPEDVNWPHWWSPRLAQRLPGGPISARIHSTTLLTGARMLTHGVTLPKGALADTRILVIMQSPDHKVHPSAARGWQDALPHCTIETIHHPGHADLAGSLRTYERIIDGWLKS